MARIKDSSKHDVRAAADMIEVVSGRTQLRRASGTRYTGRCPFHEERTPSFSVNPVDKLFYCFGCGKGGDIFDFVQETENVDFVGAIEWLAERFRVPLEYEEASPRIEAERRKRERLLALLESTTAYFERVLWEGGAGRPVREYLTGRGLGEEISREFRLGLSPGRGLAQKAKEKGFSLDELRGAGLATVRGGDYFPQRLMFPLCDARGRIVGFQARRLHEDDPLRGKYVNSPEGDLFKKSAILYGLHLARSSIAKQDRAAVVEGNTDVIALRQAGFEPVVASMGTALTERQLRELGRLTRRIFLCFDADAAGQEATLRGMELAAAQGFDVKVVTLPRGQDPADAPDGFEDRLEGAESYLLYRVRLELDRSSDRQEGFVRVREVLAKAEDSPERQEALRLVADRLDLPRETLSGLAPARSGGDGGSGGAEAPRLLEAGDRLERDALAACLAHPSLVRGLAELGPEYFDSDVARRFRAALVSGRDDPELTSLHAELDARATREAIDERTGKELLLRLRERRLKRDLAGADLARTTELQAHLAKVRQALAELT
jgi:DNA primase